MNTPTLRFKEFSGAWEVKNVGDVCDCIVPGRNKPIEFNGDIPWITTPDIEQNGLVVRSKKNLNITLEEAKNVGSKIVPKNSIVISCVGELGLVAITGVDLIINQQLHAFIPKESVYFKFLLYALTIQKPYMEKVATKTALPYMNKDNCNSIPVFLPTLPEQTKIAQLSQTAQLLTDYKKGVMQQIFSQQLRFKDDDGREFAEWEVKSLGNLAAIYDGTHMTPDYQKSGIPFYSVEHITSNNFKDTKFISSEVFEKENKRVKLEKGDILMTKIGDIGTPKYIDWNVEASFYVSLALIKQSKKANSLYLMHYIKTSYFQHELHKRIIHVAFPKKINLGEIGNCLVQLPCEKEQTKIANFLTAIDDKINNNQTQLDAMKQYKSGLLQQMFV